MEEATHYSKIKLSSGTQIQTGIAGPQDYPGGTGRRAPNSGSESERYHSTTSSGNAPTGNMTNETAITSPDQRKTVLLDYDGEASFGPVFFQGRSVGFDWPLDRAIIGEGVHWSADSRFVVLVIFRSRDTARPPHTELVAIDTANGTVIQIDSNSKGLIRPSGFVSPTAFEYHYVQSGVATRKEWKPPV